MRGSSVSISVILHVSLIIIASISLPWLKREFIIPPPISVEFVELSKITETDKVTPQPVKEEKKEEKKEEEKPPPAAQNTSKEAIVPEKKEDPKPDTKEEKKDNKAEEIDPNALPDKKKKDDKKKEELKKPAPTKDFSSILKNLAEPKETPTPVKTEQPPIADPSPPDAGANAPLGQKLTISEEDALRRQLERCWNVPFGAKDAENMIVEIYMEINPNRTLRTARVVDQNRYNSDTFYRAAADSALRAVMNPMCAPFELPPDKYDLWQKTTVTFNPKEMF